MSDVVQCDNCESARVFLVNDPGANPVNYCRRCLPAHLQSRANAGAFKLPKKTAAK